MNHSKLYYQIFDYENLYTAFIEARKGKRYQQAVLSFERELEENLINLQNHLIWKSWQPGKASQFTVTDPKMRQITAPPFKDRVVHHAIHQIIEPYFEKRFIHDSYACRSGKGVHKSADRLMQFLRKAKREFGDRFYIVKFDIKSYFASIDHESLIKQFSKTITDQDVVDLYTKCIKGYGFDNGTGLPVGALTSQLSANIMLDKLDHIVKDQWGIKYYVRYMDDFVILCENRQQAKLIMQVVQDELSEIKLTLNPKSCYFPWQRGVDFCGYRMWPTHSLPRKRTVKRARKRIAKSIKLYKSGRLRFNSIKTHILSFCAYMNRCDSHVTLKQILDESAF